MLRFVSRPVLLLRLLTPDLGYSPPATAEEEFYSDEESEEIANSRIPDERELSRRTATVWTPSGFATTHTTGHTVYALLNDASVFSPCSLHCTGCSSV